MSKKVTIASDGSATVVDAKVGDILETAISTDSAVTGTYGLIQKGVLLGLGFLIGRN